MPTCELVANVDCVILQKPECNFLVHLDDSQFKAFKSIVIDMVCVYVYVCTLQSTIVYL